MFTFFVRIFHIVYDSGVHFVMITDVEFVVFSGEPEWCDGMVE